MARRACACRRRRAAKGASSSSRRHDRAERSGSDAVGSALACTARMRRRARRSRHSKNDTPPLQNTPPLETLHLQTQHHRSKTHDHRSSSPNFNDDFRRWVSMKLLEAHAAAAAGGGGGAAPGAPQKVAVEWKDAGGKTLKACPLEVRARFSSSSSSRRVTPRRNAAPRAAAALAALEHPSTYPPRRARRFATRISRRARAERERRDVERERRACGGHRRARSSTMENHRSRGWVCAFSSRRPALGRERARRGRCVARPARDHSSRRARASLS